MPQSSTDLLSIDSRPKNINFDSHPPFPPSPFRPPQKTNTVTIPCCSSRELWGGILPGLSREFLFLFFSLTFLVLVLFSPAQFFSLRRRLFPGRRREEGGQISPPTIRAFISLSTWHFFLSIVRQDAQSSRLSQVGEKKKKMKAGAFVCTE